MIKNKEFIIKSLSLRPFGSQGWFRGNAACPECGRKDKFGILFTEDSAIVHCFYDSYKTSLLTYLRLVNRKDLIDSEDYIIEVKKSLSSLKKEAKEEVKSEFSLPIGFRYINFDGYLFDRGFIESDFKKFKVGVANLDPRTEDKVVFVIPQNGEDIAWLARSRKSKEWHDDNLRKSKEGTEELVLRYRNSDNNFNEILGGLDDITEKTHTVILVEGLMDKANVDRLLGLDYDEDIKCCFTFGSDISDKQVDLLLNKPNVDTIILLYDAGTVKKMKTSAGRLFINYNVLVSIIRDEDIDPGNCTLKELNDFIFNLKNFIEFYGSLQ